MVALAMGKGAAFANDPRHCYHDRRQSHHSRRFVGKLGAGGLALMDVRSELM